MKKFILALTVLFTMTVSASAMSYEQARQQALFLTDKMAYELNLTEDQYEAAYEVNLDYLMGVTDYNDLYGSYWQQRNLDLSYILLDWQYRAFVDATYFYRPLYWNAGYWHFGIYARYPHRDYFYFGRPHFYGVYRGGHSWRVNGGRSWYHGRQFGSRNNNNRFGMRDGFNRGDFGRGNKGMSAHRNGSTGNNRTFGNGTRNNNRNNGVGMNSNRQNGNRTFGSGANRNNNSTFGNRQSSTRTTVTRPNGNIGTNRNFGGSSNGSCMRGSSSAPSRTFAPNRSSSSSSAAPSRQSAPSRSFGSSSSSSRSFGSSHGSSSMGSSRSSGSSSSSHSGGGHFGGRR